MIACARNGSRWVSLLTPLPYTTWNAGLSNSASVNPPLLLVYSAVGMPFNNGWPVDTMRPTGMIPSLIYRYAGSAMTLDDGRPLAAVYIIRTAPFFFDYYASEHIDL